MNYTALLKCSVVSFIFLAIGMTVLRMEDPDEGRRQLKCVWKNWKHSTVCSASSNVHIESSFATPTKEIFSQPTQKDSENKKGKMISISSSRKARPPIVPENVSTSFLSSILRISSKNRKINMTSYLNSNSTSNYFIGGQKLAALYHSQKCLHTRNQSRFQKLQKIAPWAVQEARVMNSPYISADFNETRNQRGRQPTVAYIRNEKVASTLLDGKTLLYSGSQGAKTRFPFRRGPQGPSSIKCSNVYFTFVREPIHTFISGWLQGKIVTHSVLTLFNSFIFLFLSTSLGS